MNKDLELGRKTINKPRECNVANGDFRARCPQPSGGSLSLSRRANRIWMGMDEGLILADESATLALGGRIAALLQIGDVIALHGDLGAGKTTLARGILQALGLETEAPSPTFAIVQPYAPPETRIPVWHVDLYRLEDPAEAVELGLDEARRDTAMLIEWPERLGAGLWPDALKLQLSIAPQDVGQSAARRLTATVPPAWEARWSSA